MLFKKTQTDTSNKTIKHQNAKHKIILIILAALLVNFASAQQPTLLSLQGKLTNTSTGAKILSADLRVNITDSSKSLIFNHSFSNAVSNGMFDLLLGSTYYLNLSYNEDYNLSLYVGDSDTPVGGPYWFRGGQGQVGAGDIATTESYVFGKVNISDSLNVSNTVQATTFIGDGSLLSGINTDFTNLSDINVTNFAANNTLFVNGSRVGIGTTTPDGELTVLGNISISTTGNGVKFPDSSHMITAFLPKGYLQRAKFTFNSTESINISAGVYEVNGRLVEWDTTIEYSPTSLGATDWSYIYIDDSAVTTGTDLTATEFIDSTTEPVWSDSKHGWYNGNDRVIFAVRTDGSSNILEFFHDGGDLVTFADVIVDGTVDIDDAWLDQSFTAPKFATKILIRIWQSTYTSGPILHYRVNGQAGTTGYTIKNAGSTNGRTNNQDIILTDGNQIAEFKADISNTDAWDFKTNGWFMSVGI